MGKAAAGLSSTIMDNDTYYTKPAGCVSPSAPFWPMEDVSDADGCHVGPCNWVMRAAAVHADGCTSSTYVIGCGWEAWMSDSMA